MKEEMFKEILTAKELQIYQLSTLLNIFQAGGLSIKGFVEYGEDFEVKLLNALITDAEYRKMIKDVYVPVLIADEEIRGVYEYVLSKEGEVTYDDLANAGFEKYVTILNETEPTPQWVKDIAEYNFKLMVINAKLEVAQKNFSE